MSHVHAHPRISFSRFQNEPMQGLKEMKYDSVNRLLSPPLWLSTVRVLAILALGTLSILTFYLHRQAPFSKSPNGSPGHNSTLEQAPDVGQPYVRRSPIESPLKVKIGPAASNASQDVKTTEMVASNALTSSSLTTSVKPRNAADSAWGVPLSDIKLPPETEAFFAADKRLLRWRAVTINFSALLCDKTVKNIAVGDPVRLNLFTDNILTLTVTDAFTQPIGYVDLSAEDKSRNQRASLSISPAGQVTGDIYSDRLSFQIDAVVGKGTSGRPQMHIIKQFRPDLTPPPVGAFYEAEERTAVPPKSLTPQSAQ